MNVVEKNIPVAMKRATLENLPAIEPPAGYVATWHVPGDEKTWVEVQRKAEKHITITPELFTREFGTDTGLLGKRQCFLRASDGTAVATASAWFMGTDPSSPVGRIHWVAVVPDLQGRGLGKALLSVVCRRMKELGHTAGWLGTHTVRVPAINLYLSFGFVPDIRSTEEAAVWREMRKYLRR